MEKVRLDKWLWSVRLYKSRTLATNSCKGGKVLLNEKVAKPSSLVSVGDDLFIRKNGFNFNIEVVQLIKKRVSAVLAQPCYIDHTPEEELNKYKSWFIGKAAAERREKGAGRPTKRERREIDDYKEESFETYFSYEEED